MRIVMHSMMHHPATNPYFDRQPRGFGFGFKGHRPDSERQTEA
jgi:hypothetical protein